MRCLVIDDEPLARQILEGYIEQLTSLSHVGSCKNAVEAFTLLHQEKIDLMFLDINMPGINGLNFLKSLNNPPIVIFTTAYAEYAVEAFELEAADYLLKPITPERFLKSIQKVIGKKVEITPNNSEVKSIFVKVDKRLVKINFEDILYIEALGDYIKIITPEETFVTYHTMNKFEELLPTQYFGRIHRSFIINLMRIKFLEGNYLKIGEVELPIGASFKEALMMKLSAN
jgi:DNA-binding LytR/AlgR family response regulator